MQDSGLMTIPEYVNRQPANEPMTGTTPLQVAEELHNYADKSLKQAGFIRRQVKEMSGELRMTLADIEAMAYLGNYYASKILGAVELCLFEKSQNQENKKRAVQHLLEAQKHWENYASVASKQYRPQLLARTRTLDWMKILEEVKKDIDIARQSGITR